MQVGLTVVGMLFQPQFFQNFPPQVSVSFISSPSPKNSEKPKNSVKSKNSEKPKVLKSPQILKSSEILQSAV